MSHPLVLALFESPTAAAAGAQAAHDLGVVHDQLSVIARTRDEEDALARALDGTLGVEIEDSRVAARLGELAGYVIAAVGLVMPGIGSIIAGGPLAAELGEAAGHAAGGIASALAKAGLSTEVAADWQKRVRDGGVVLGIHVTTGDVDEMSQALIQSGAVGTALAEWD